MAIKLLIMKTLLTVILLCSLFQLRTFAQNNNYSLQFDGVDDYITLSNNLGSTSTVTLNCWAKFPQIPDDDQGDLISNWAGGNGAYTLRYDSYLGNHTISCNIEAALGGEYIEFPLDSNNYNTWMYITFTYDGDTLRLYQNGSLKSEVINSKGALNSATTNIMLGTREDLNPNFRFFGNMDEVSIWNIELDSLEINQYMNCPPTGTETGLLGYWKFEEGTGTTAVDATSNANNGTINGGAIWSTDVPVQTFCCTSSITNDTTIYFVADSNFSIVSPTVCLDSIDSLFTINGGCDSILNHYTEYLFNAAYYTDTVFITDTTFVTINDTIDVFDTTFVTVTDTVTVNDTTFVTVYDETVRLTVSK